MDKSQARKKELSTKDTYITKIIKEFGIQFPLSKLWKSR